MQKQYFNTFEFRQALDLQTINPHEACIKFKEYINNYPEDYSAYCYYASTLLMLGNNLEIEEMLNKAKYLADHDYKFKLDSNKYVHFLHEYYFALIKLYCYNSDYEKAYDLLLNHSNEISLNIGHLLFYIKKKLNMPFKGSVSKLSYLYKQILNYKEEDFIHHIKKHTQDFNKNLDNPNSSFFTSDFPLIDVINEVKKYIPSNKGLFRGFIEDEYTFKYMACGKYKNKMVDYFIINAFHNTNQYITMCPTDNANERNYIDLDYMIKEKVQTKRLSQIDKFNKKYNL